jgi:hypothetical protein
MEEYPSNSKLPPREDEPRSQKVIQGEAVQRKTPLGKKIGHTFVQGHGREVWGYVVFDVLLPAARDMVADAATSAVERMLFGEVRSTSRRTGARPTGGSYYNYNKQYANHPGDPRAAESNRTPVRRRNSYDFGEIVLNTRVEAEAVVDQMYDNLEKYGNVQVADLLDMVGKPSNFVDENWGWTSLNGTDVRRVHDGYLLVLPRTEALPKSR